VTRWSRIRVLAPLVAATALAAAPRQAGTPASPPRPAVIGYLFPQDAVIDPATLAADKLTHVNVAKGRRGSTTRRQRSGSPTTIPNR